MTTFPTGTEPGIESELIDLSTVPFAILRDLNDAALRGAMRHAVERAGQVSAKFRSGNPTGGGERID